MCVHRIKSQKSKLYNHTNVTTTVSPRQFFCNKCVRVCLLHLYYDRLSAIHQLYYTYIEGMSTEGAEERVTPHYALVHEFSGLHIWKPIVIYYKR